nr:SpoIIIAH-like family protein [Desulfitobacterium hafniense]
QEAKAMLSPLLNSNVDKAREQAQVKWLELTKKIEKEEEIENFLKIKGFQDLIADVNPDSISIIIYASSLTPNEVSLIQDAVTRITKIRLDKISISYKK